MTPPRPQHRSHAWRRRKGGWTVCQWVHPSLTLLHQSKRPAKAGETKQRLQRNYTDKALNGTQPSAPTVSPLWQCFVLVGGGSTSTARYNSSPCTSSFCVLISLASWSALSPNRPWPRSMFVQPHVLGACLVATAVIPVTTKPLHHVHNQPCRSPLPVHAQTRSVVFSSDGTELIN